MVTGENRGPLAGIRILETSNVVAGPTACQILGDFGAEIIKVEHPNGGDGMRRQGFVKGESSIWWRLVGRNKRSVGMYLGDPDAAKVFLELVKTADVVVEGFRPGTFEKWGLGYDVMSAVNPGLIFARLSGFGQNGPYASRPAFGTLIESMSGFASLTGEPDGAPTLPPFAMADYVAGISLVGAITMALYNRDARGGKGQVIDVSVFEPLMSTLGAAIVRTDQLENYREPRTGNRSINTAPRNVYPTKDDKWVGVSAATNELAARIIELCGRPDLVNEPWFKSGRGRVDQNDLLDEVVGNWIKERTRDEVMALAEKAEVTFAPIYEVAEMMEDPHIKATQMVTTVKDPQLGDIRMPNVLFRMSETPGSIRWTGPALGNATNEILVDELGIDAATLQPLRERGALL